MKLVLLNWLLEILESFIVAYIIKASDISELSKLVLVKLDCTKLVPITIEFVKLHSVKVMPLRYALEISLFEKSVPVKSNFKVRFF
jgi:hypothetical protein